MNAVSSDDGRDGRVPPVRRGASLPAATGIMKDGDVLILSMTRFENGKPDRSVISLTIGGDTMSIAQMLEFSPNIKRGSGRKE